MKVADLKQYSGKRVLQSSKLMHKTAPISGMQYKAGYRARKVLDGRKNIKGYSEATGTAMKSSVEQAGKVSSGIMADRHDHILGAIRTEKYKTVYRGKRIVYHKSSQVTGMIPDEQKELKATISMTQYQMHKAGYKARKVLDTRKKSRITKMRQGTYVDSGKLKRVEQKLAAGDGNFIKNIPRKRYQKKAKKQIIVQNMTNKELKQFGRQSSFRQERILEKAVKTDTPVHMRQIKGSVPGRVVKAGYKGTGKTIKVYGKTAYRAGTVAAGFMTSENKSEVLKNQARQTLKRQAAKPLQGLKQKFLRGTRRMAMMVLQTVVQMALTVGSVIMSLLAALGAPVIIIAVLILLMAGALGADISIERTPPLYTQYDRRWDNVQFGEGVMNEDGALVCTAAMVASYLKNDTRITPKTLVAECKAADYYDKDTGMNTNFLDKVERKYSITFEDCGDDFSQIQTRMTTWLNEMAEAILSGDDLNDMPFVAVMAITKENSILGRESIPVMIWAAGSNSESDTAIYRVNSPMDNEEESVYYNDYELSELIDACDKFYYCYTGTSADSGASETTGADIAAFAKKYVGAPYVLGGTSITTGIDCSGFTQFVYGHFGYSLPRTSAEQRNSGTPVQEADLKPGDLVCYEGHVAIYLGFGQVISAEAPGVGVKIENNIRYCSNRLIGFRRIISSASANSMIWPLPTQYHRLSTEYGVADAFGNPGHCGVDFPAPSGTPVYAAADGTVLEAGFASSMGNYVKIDHGGGICTVYMHASRLTSSAGQKVKAGDKIMEVGTTGPSTGNHLHFSVMKNGAFVNPHPYFANDISSWN